MTATEQQLELCIKKLRTAEFEPLREYLRSMVAERLDELSKGEDTVRIYRLQGEAKALRGILRLVAEKRG